MITFDEKNRMFKLDTKNTTYSIAVVDEEGFAGHVYYGRRISDGALHTLRINENPFVPSVNNRDRSSFLDSFPTEFAGNNVGDYREGAIAIKDVNGGEAVSFFYEGYEITDKKPILPGLPSSFAGKGRTETLILRLKDDAAGLKAELYYTLFADIDIITRSVSIINCGDAPVKLTRIMSLCLDMEAEDYELMTLHGSWARERAIDVRPIGYGRTNVGSARGETSHQEHPFLGLVSPRCAQDNGEVYGFNFIYSGNFLAQVEKNQFDSLRVTMGINPEYFEFEIKPGENFYAPEAVMTYSDRGLSAMTQNFHDFFREHIIRSPYKDKPRPVLINNWEATYFDFNTDKLLDIAREAAKSGIEMLVMDDGWFGHRNDDNTSLGDWFVNESKINGGLRHLVDEVNALGLKFGIWLEPEMISKDSEAYKAHPDYCIKVKGRTPAPSRNQYVMDLSRPEVVDFVYDQVKKVLSSANIEYVKWDMNRQLCDLGSIYLDSDHQGELSHRYVLAVYEMQERLLSDFPNLLLENCSGGGARFDGGMLYYSPQIWCSDDTDAVERLMIQEGTALVYPVSAMGAHVSDCPNHTVGRVTPFETRGRVALCGTFGYELDITKISEEDRAAIPGQIEKYHKYNSLISTGDYYRLASYSKNRFYDAYMIVSKDKNEAIMTFVQVLGRPNHHSRLLKLSGLDPEKEYMVEFENDEKSNVRAHGDTLMNAGLLVRNMWGDFASTLVYIHSV